MFALEQLYKHRPEARQLIADEKLGVPEAQLRWMPIRGTRSFWTVLIDANSSLPLAYIPIDPYES
jgi:hypothetical protein